MSSEKLNVNQTRQVEEEPTVKVVFKLPNGKREIFKILLDKGTHITPAALLNKIIDIGKLSGSHMFKGGQLMSTTDSVEMKSGDLIEVEYNPSPGSPQSPGFKISPEVDKRS